MKYRTFALFEIWIKNLHFQEKQSLLLVVDSLHISCTQNFHCIIMFVTPQSLDPVTHEIIDIINSHKIVASRLNFVYFELKSVRRF